MNLSPDYTYLFLDFETTGLDVTTDYPIQIALVEVDHHFRVQRSYSSYISLPSDSETLNTNISYITGIDDEILAKEGKDIEIVRTEITDFFGENSILIGQNIEFDINFLKKFFPGCNFNFSIDSYKLGASSLLYLNSYSLEGFDKHLSHKPTYKEFKSNLLQFLSPDRTIDAHDALYDCIVGIAFFHRWVDKYKESIEKYPILHFSSQKQTKDSLFRIIKSSKIIDHPELILPRLSAPIKENIPGTYSKATNWEKVVQHNKFSTKGLSLQQIIRELPDNAIIAVSHGSKIDIIKNACPDTQFEYLKEEQILDQDTIHHRLQKPSFSDDEILFILFYCIHHLEGYRVLNPTLPVHKYILSYLHKTVSGTQEKKQILCSHGGLYYTLLQSGRRDEYKDRPICILDADWWHITYNNYAQKGINLHFSFAQWENCLYTLQQNNNEQQRNDFEQIFKQRELFVGYFGIASDHELGPNTKRDFDYLPYTAQYTKSLELLKNTIKDRTRYTSTYTMHPEIHQLLNKIQNLIKNPVTIYRNVFNNNETSYTIAPSVQYIDFSEYLKLFKDQKVLFFSANRPEYHKWLTPKKEEKTALMHLQYDSVEQIITQLSTLSGNTFIISHSAHKSKKLFHELTISHLTQTHSILGEYLTGGIGKIANLTNNDTTIIIGGYHLLLALRAHQKPIQNIIIFSLPASLKPLIDADIDQYSPQ